MGFDELDSGRILRPRSDDDATFFNDSQTFESAGDGDSDPGRGMATLSVGAVDQPPAAEHAPRR